VKPQSLDSLTAGLKGEAEEELKNFRILSIAAGKNIDYFIARLGTTQVVRYMPNIAATVGRSVVGIAFSPDCSKEYRAAALDIAGSIGLAVELPEHLIPSITGLSGSGIAFVYSFLHAMTLGGVSQGIDYSKSLEIAVETLRGAADMVSAFGGPAELITRVCSPAGTTIEGIKVLEDGRFTAVVMDAIEAAARKAALMEG